MPCINTIYIYIQRAWRKNEKLCIVVRLVISNLKFVLCLCVCCFVVLFVLLTVDQPITCLDFYLGLGVWRREIEENGVVGCTLNILYVGTIDIYENA
jgi:hypothetical protein